MANERDGVNVYLGFEIDPESFWSLGEVPVTDLPDLPGVVRGLLHNGPHQELAAEGELLVSGNDQPVYYITLKEVAA